MKNLIGKAMMYLLWIAITAVCVYAVGRKIALISLGIMAAFVAWIFISLWLQD